MSISQSLLPEFDQEFANTRKMLERVPDDRLAWKPHPKSMSMGGLATHIAEVPGWMGTTIVQDSFDVAPPDGPKYVRQDLKSRKEILEMFDKNLPVARAALANSTDAQLMAPWTMLKGGQKIFSMPRIAVVRSFLLNHNVHHRAQLSVYLRLNDVPVPGMYGPSADEVL
jgi:uncharacterized damage-inducible protein DinB